MRIGATLCIALSMAGFSAWTEESVLAEFPMDTLDELRLPKALPEGIAVALEPGDAAAAGSVKVTHTGTGTHELMLLEVPLAGIDEAELWYEASLRSEGSTGKAYLALYCSFTGKGSFFSRALNDPFTGTAPWRDSRTAFFLRKGETPSGVSLGVRFEGPATVWIDNVRLVRRDLGSDATLHLGVGAGKGFWERLRNNPGALLGSLGGVFGAFIGLWGGLCGILGCRGRGRRFVLISGIVILVVSAGIAATGLCLALLGHPWSTCYPLVMTGGLVAVILGFVLPIVMRRYRETEAARMAALDHSENL